MAIYRSLEVMNSVRVIVDVGSVYHGTHRKHNCRKVDYGKLKYYVEGFGNVIQLTAYGHQVKSEATPFIDSQT